MAKWEDFEVECTDYLNKYFGDYAKFTHQGGADSTAPDIFVVANSGKTFYIEVKEPDAQSGQFVLLPDETNKIFTFSPRNKTLPNEFTEIIIDHMNNDFDRFNNAGTAGQSLDIDKRTFVQWIVSYFKSKGVKYFITKGTSYIIFPTAEFEIYFNITAKYRVKRSGSTEPSIKNQSNVINTLKSDYGITDITTKGKKMFVTGNSSLNKVRFVICDYEYYLSPQDANIYEVRQLSNTYNMNIIFSISLKKEQDPADRIIFEDEF